MLRSWFAHTIPACPAACIRGAQINSFSLSPLRAQQLNLRLIDIGHCALLGFRLHMLRHGADSDESNQTVIKQLDSVLPEGSPVLPLLASGIQFI